MQKRNFTIKEKIALIVIAALIIAVAVIGAVIIVGNTNRANEELLNTEHTTIEIVTEAESETETNSDTTEKKAANTTSKTSSEASSTAEQTLKETTATKSTASTSSTSKTSNSENKNKPGKIEPATNATHASKKICTVNGKKCYVGDTITVAINLKTPVVLENYQGYTKFDGSYLEYINVEMNSGGFFNEQDGVIYYNASVLSGIDFTSEGTIYTATFKVKKEGSTEIKNTIQILTDLNDKAVEFSDCKEEVKIYD